jgi:hypothetical protein
MASNDEVERRGIAQTTNEADLSQSSTPPWLIEDAPRDRSNRLLGVMTPPWQEAMLPAYGNHGDLRQSSPPHRMRPKSTQQR